MKRISPLFVAGLFVTLAAVSAGAQPPRGMNPRRDALEEQLRVRTAEIVKRRLELTDTQMQQLQVANREFERQRGALFMRERETRRQLREEVLLGNRASQSRVAELIDQTLQLERQRLDLIQNEQRELARFLTPVQRARLLAMQSELRQRAQEMRRRTNRRGGPPPRRNEMPFDM